MSTSTTLYYDELETPIGILTLLGDGASVLRIDFGTMTNLEEKYLKWVKRYFGQMNIVHDPTAFKKAKEELSAYFKGNIKSFTFSYKFHGTPFQQQVWQALVDTIPFGQTKSYKDIAEIIGNPKAVRAVGGAVNKNPFSIVVPCHRVIGSNGSMVGYNGGLDKKEYLLSFEKENNQSSVG